MPSKKIKAVDIATEAEPETTKEAEDNPEPSNEAIEDVVEKVEEVVDPVEEVVVNDDEVKPTKQPEKRTTCPDCGKTMLDRNFRHKHIRICGKPKIPRARPIEEVIKEKREKVVAEPMPIETPLPPPPPPPSYWELRKQYNNELHQRKQQLVKRLVSKAF